MIELHKYSFMCAIIGYVYSFILTEPDMILNPVYKFLDKRLPEELFKPIMSCYKCVCGQIALWVGLVVIYDGTTPTTFKSVFTHFYFVCITIFLSIIINKIYEAVKTN